MHQHDGELDRLFSRIESLEAEYNRAKAEKASCQDQMNSAWNSLHDLQVKYRELKNLADEEFQAASFCWETGDKASAKIHSENGKDLNERKSWLSSDLDNAHWRFDSMKAAYEQAREHQNRILEELKDARAAKNLILEERKRLKAEEEAHWHEKSCKKCGAPIRYRDDWNHIPNYCKECKANFDAEKQAREKLKHEKPCRGCGKPIIYYDDWTHIPNYCKECREKGNTWSSLTEKKLPKKADTYGILDYSHGIRKQNSKDLNDGTYGTHKWYDPYTGKMGEAGPNYPGTKRKPRYD